MNKKKLIIKDEAGLIKAIIKSSDYTYEEISNILGIRRQSFCNKLQRNSFSMHEFIVIAYLCEHPIKVGSGDLKTINEILIGNKTLEKIAELRSSKKEIRQNWFNVIGYLYKEDK